MFQNSTNTIHTVVKITKLKLTENYQETNHTVPEALSLHLIFCAEESELSAILIYAFELLVLHLKITAYCILLTNSIPLNTIMIQNVAACCITTLHVSAANMLVETCCGYCILIKTLHSYL